MCMVDMRHEPPTTPCTMPGKSVIIRWLSKAGNIYSQEDGWQCKLGCVY